jgi:DNA-binding XRE family transcriptional regulator
MMSDHVHRPTLAWTLDVAKLERVRILRRLTQRRLAMVSHVDRGTLGDLC